MKNESLQIIRKEISENRQCRKSLESIVWTVKPSFFQEKTDQEMKEVIEDASQEVFFDSQSQGFVDGALAVALIWFVTNTLNGIFYDLTKAGFFSLFTKKSDELDTQKQKIIYIEAANKGIDKEFISLAERWSENLTPENRESLKNEIKNLFEKEAQQHIDFLNHVWQENPSLHRDIKGQNN